MLDVHDDASGRRRETVQRLGAALTTLKHERGAPSYGLLHRRGVAPIPSLAPMSRSSISELLAGKHGPRSLDRLLWLVRLPLAYQDGEEVAVPGQNSAARRRPPHPVADSGRRTRTSRSPASSWRTPSAIWRSPWPRCSRSRHSPEPEPASAPAHLVGRFSGPAGRRRAAYRRRLRRTVLAPPARGAGMGRGPAMCAWPVVLSRTREGRGGDEADEGGDRAYDGEHHSDRSTAEILAGMGAFHLTRL